MGYNISKFEFACEIFGHENAKSINSGVIQLYYNDWKSSGMDFSLFKSLLKTRG